MCVCVCVPKHSPLLSLRYMLAYLSRLWNRVASRRMHVFGAKLVSGDLVSTQRVRDVYAISDGSLNVSVATDADVKASAYSKPEIRNPNHSELESLKANA